jgi:peptide/nickel transport system ATP-binding protein
MTRLQADHGLTYLIISHDVRSFVTYQIELVMYLGKLVEIGPSEVVYAQPAHPYTRGLIAAVPVADPTAERSKVDDAPPGELPSSINPPSECRFGSRCLLAQAVCAEVEPPLRARDLRSRPVLSH